MQASGSCNLAVADVVCRSHKERWQRLFAVLVVSGRADRRSFRAATRIQWTTVLEGKGRGLFVGTNPQSHEPWKKPAKGAVESGRAQVFGFAPGSWACSQIQECA